MRTECGKKIECGKSKTWISLGNRALSMLCCMIFFIVFPMTANAQELRKVRVAFFPMDGFHTYSEADGYGGMDVAYLEELCGYTKWELVYVECDSWDDALVKLEAGEVDLVGSAQYSKERSERFDYASLDSGYTFGCMFVEGDSNLAFEDFERMKEMEFGVVESYVRKGEFLEYLHAKDAGCPEIG